MINKYYIMDLNENKSMVQYLLKKGVDVFLISWIKCDLKIILQTLLPNVKKPLLVKMIDVSPSQNI